MIDPEKRRRLQEKEEGLWDEAFNTDNPNAFDDLVSFYQETRGWSKSETIRIVNGGLAAMAESDDDPDLFEYRLEDESVTLDRLLGEEWRVRSSENE